MTLQLMSVVFETGGTGMDSTRTVDGRNMSILFDSLSAQSQPSDASAEPEVTRAEGVIRCSGQGWVTVQVRGAAIVAGEHGYAHVVGWANGSRLRASTDDAMEPFVAAAMAQVRAGGELRISLLLLAQRDLASDNTSAGCWIDSIDVQVVDPARTVPAGSR